MAVVVVVAVVNLGGRNAYDSCQRWGVRWGVSAVVVLVEVLVVERVEGGFKRDAINITSLTDNLVHIVLPINHEAVGVQLNQVIDEHDNRHIK